MKALKASLAIAVLALTGCQGAAPSEILISQVGRSAALVHHAGNAALTLNLALPARAAYDVLATSSDIARIEVTLLSGSETVDRTTLSRAQMTSGKGQVTFSQLAAGSYTLVLTAYDASGKNIGTSRSAASIQAGQTTHLAAALKLDATPSPGKTGSLVATVTIVDGDPAPNPTPHPEPSPMTGKLVPAHGALWGFYQQGNADFAPLEQQLKRPFDLVKRYHDFSNQGDSGVFPTAEEKAIVAKGQILDVSWNSTIWNSPDPKLAKPANGKYYTYKQITTGALDGYIDTVAARVRALGKPMFMDFDHEADGAKAQNYGTPDEFRAAFRYVVERFRADGADNAVWCFTVTGYCPNSNPNRAGAYYPGDDVVDWIAWDPYNHDGNNWKDPYTTFSEFYNRIEGGIFGEGAKNKPWKLSEYGCSADPRRAAWFQAIPAALARLPKLKAVEYFDSGSWGEFTNASGDIAAFATAGRDPYVNPYNR